MVVDPNDGIKKQDNIVKYNLTALQKATTVKGGGGAVLVLARLGRSLDICIFILLEILRLSNFLNFLSFFNSLVCKFSNVLEMINCDLIKVLDDHLTRQ